MEEKERYKWSQDVIIECAYEDYDYIVDTENNIIFSDDNYFKLVDLLNQQDKRIKELEQENLSLQEQSIRDNQNWIEEQLANAIVPKFKTYQQVYTISKFYTSTNGIPEYEIFNSYYYVAENENEIIVGWNYKKDFNQRKYYYIRKDWVFATKEEAEAKLRELG